MLVTTKSVSGCAGALEQEWSENEGFRCTSAAVWKAQRDQPDAGRKILALINSQTGTRVTIGSESDWFVELVDFSPPESRLVRNPVGRSHRDVGRSIIRRMQGRSRIA
jgi:hypothetical protein